MAKACRYAIEMAVGEEVRNALDHWSAGRWQEALRHACEAADETARKRYQSLGVAARFKQTLRDDVDIFSAMTAPDIDLVSSRFPVPVQTDQLDGRPDIADVIFGVHRYLSGHENEFPAGCEVVPHSDRESMFHISRGRLRLRASAALGLVAIAVFAPENRGEVIPGSYQLAWQQHVFHIVGWWGWEAHFREIVRNAGIARSRLDFDTEWDNWTPWV